MDGFPGPPGEGRGQGASRARPHRRLRDGFAARVPRAQPRQARAREGPRRVSRGASSGHRVDAAGNDPGSRRYQGNESGVAGRRGARGRRARVPEDGPRERPARQLGQRDSRPASHHGRGRRGRVDGGVFREGPSREGRVVGRRPRRRDESLSRGRVPGRRGGVPGIPQGPRRPLLRARRKSSQARVRQGPFRGRRGRVLLGAEEQPARDTHSARTSRLPASPAWPRRSPR